MLITIILNDNKIEANYNDLIKINYFQQLFEDKIYSEIKEIDFKNTIITYDNFLIILDFIKIDNKEINDYINSIEQVSVFNTMRMPVNLKDFLSQFNINDDKEYNKTIIEKMLKLKQQCDYLQYDLCCNVIEYQLADMYRTMNKNILKEILLENVKEIYEEDFKNKKEIDIKTLDYKCLIIIFNYYDIDEDKINDFIIKNEINDETIFNLIKKIKINNLFLKEILINNVDKIIDDLNYII